LVLQKKGQRKTYYIFVQADIDTTTMIDSTLKQELQLIKDCVEATRVDSALLKEAELETIMIKDKIDDTSEAIVERLEKNVANLGLKDEIQHLRNCIDQNTKNTTELKAILEHQTKRQYSEFAIARLATSFIIVILLIYIRATQSVANLGLKDEIQHLRNCILDQNTKNTTELEHQAKMQRLDHALAKSKLRGGIWCYDHFSYFDSTLGIYVYDSPTLIANAIFQFRRGKGYFIKQDRFFASDSRPGFKSIKTEVGFRNQLSEQIHILTGSKPRVEYNVEAEGHYMYYA
jgi:hypothetical protein